MTTPLFSPFNPASLFGPRIITNPHLTKHIHTCHAVHQSLWSKLVDHWWQPWPCTRIEFKSEIVPSDKVIVLDNNTFVCHPTIAAQIRNQLEQTERI